MNVHVKIQRRPTDGELMLASSNAADVAYECHVATLTRNQDVFDSHVVEARRQLHELARRLGYDLVPTREREDA